MASESSPPNKLKTIKEFLAEFNACRNNKFCIGDLLGRLKTQEGRWDTELVKDFQAKTNLTYSTCRQYAWVAILIPPDMRSFPHLSWSHYREVCQIDNAETRLQLLREASANQWTVRTLKFKANQSATSIKTRTGSICDAPGCQGNQCKLTLEGLNTTDSDGTFRERLHFCDKQCLQHYLETG